MSLNFSFYLYATMDFLFIFDMIVKIIALKMFGKYSYIQDGANIVDLLINILVIINLITPIISIWIRAIRACRIIAVTQMNQSLKILIISIYKSISLVLRLILFLLTFLLLFSSIGVKYLKGSTYFCSNN